MPHHQIGETLMATQQHTLHTAQCDTCGLTFGEEADFWIWDDTPALILAQVAGDPDWTVDGETVDGETVTCPATDTAHDTARGGPSPVELRPTGDAMAWSPS
ncbi:hypothetical protein [Streptomyces zhihengii]